MMSATGRIRMMRDPTRGGLAAALNEIVKEITTMTSPEAK